MGSTRRSRLLRSVLESSQSQVTASSFLKVTLCLFGAFVVMMYAELKDPQLREVRNGFMEKMQDQLKLAKSGSQENTTANNEDVHTKMLKIEIEGLKKEVDEQRKKVDEKATEGPPAPAHFYCLCKTPGACNANFCDTKLTFADPGNNASTTNGLGYNLPTSSWTTARNAMFYLAKERRNLARREGRQPASHSCFMDGDAKVNVEKDYFVEKLRNETEPRKIIVGNFRRAYSSKYLYRADAILSCFAADSLELYLPYSTLKDHEAWYLSQLDLIVRANLLEPFAFKVYLDVNVWNPRHGNYPRDGEPGRVALMEEQRRQGYSDGCFLHTLVPDPRFVNSANCTWTDPSKPDSEPTPIYSMIFNDTHALGHY